MVWRGGECGTRVPDSLTTPAVGESDDDERCVSRGPDERLWRRLDEMRLRVHAERPLDGE